jgi:hypothetical protein
MKWTTLSLLAAVACLGTSTASQAQGAKGIRIAIVQSGYPGSSRAAKGFLDTLTSYLGKETALDGLSATYHNVPKDALADIAKTPPRFGVVSLGFYLENRHKLGLVVRLETTPLDRYFVVVKRGTATSLDELRRQKVAGGALYEPRFVGSVVFPQAPIEDWKVEPTLRPSRALRKLTRGDYRALVLNGREYRSFEALGKMQGLMKIAESKDLPVALVVSFGKTLKKGEAKTATKSPEIDKLVDAFRKLQKEKSGREILRAMGCKEFREVDAKRLASIEKQFDARRAKTPKK